MRVMFSVLFVNLVIPLFGCNENKAASESLVFRFEGAGREEGGGFVCYPSRYGGWLCEAGTEDGCAKHALHIEAETDSLRCLFEAVRDAESVVNARERVEEHSTLNLGVEEHIGRPFPPDSRRLEVAYSRSGKRNDVRVIKGTRNIARLLQQDPRVTHVYRQAIDPLELPKAYWFRDLAPTAEEIRHGQWAPLPRE